jgi:diacylglycerol kinase (ATP)
MATLHASAAAAASAPGLARAHGVILNPSAQGGRGRERFAAVATDEEVAGLGLLRLPLFDGAGAVDAEERGHALVEWLTWQVRHGRRHFVAAGGDGTVNFAVNGLLAVRKRLGLPREVLRLGAIGIGSSNDFLKPADVIGRGRAAGGVGHRLDFTHAFAHDVGQLEILDLVTGKPVVRHFVVNASVGISAEGCWIYNRNGWLMRWLKQRWIDLAVLAAGLHTVATYRNVRAQVTLDGVPLAGGDEVAITNLGIVKNVHFTGSMRYDVPRAADDGVFGVHLAAGMGRVETLRTMNALGQGRFTGRARTSSREAREVVIESARPFTMEADGEVARTTRARLRLLPGELMIAP